MSAGRKPSFRITYKAKDGTRYDVGVAWDSERFPGLFDLRPQKTNEGGDWPKMRLSEAAARCESGDGFLSIAAPKPASGQRQPEGNRSPAKRSVPADDYDGSDIPF